MLRTLPERGFGYVSLNERMFYGGKQDDPKVPKSYFATDRLVRHPNAPVIIDFFEASVVCVTRG